MFNPWLDLSFKAFQLGLETQSVVALRMMRLASGGARAQTEARRMVSEKAAAAVKAQVAATAAALAGHRDHVIAGKALKVFRKTGSGQQAPAFSSVARLAAQPHTQS